MREEWHASVAITLASLRQIDFIAACGAALLAVLLVALPDNALMRAILSFGVQGWALTAGVRYHVSVSGVSQPIEYDVDVVDCGA
ncbi:MAG: hypothetical protein U0168_09210 [Nannocystaceae bacterium]